MIKYGYNENGILFKPNNTRLADPENPDNVANATENSLEVPFPWICQHHQSKIPRNDARQQCHHVDPVTGTNTGLSLTTSMKIKHHQKLNC